MFKTMKILVIILILFSAPSVVFSAGVKFHGLKAGMTKKEVIQYLQLAKIANHSKQEYPSLYRDKNDSEIIEDIVNGKIHQFKLEEICSHKDFSNKDFAFLALSFTQDNILWRIGIYFVVPDDSLEEIAMKKAIKKYFPGYKIQEDSSTSDYGTTNYYVVVMVDHTISDLAIQKYVKSFLKKM